MAKKKTTKEFVQKAKAIYGDKYDYTKTNYVNSNTPIIVMCNKHGEFKVLPGKHLHRNQGCPLCSKRTNWSFRGFMDELQKKQPHYFDDKEILNYSDICDLSEKDFKIEKTVFVLKCKKDGYVWKTHGKQMLLNNGCRKCSGYLKKTKEEYISEVASKYPTILDQFSVIGNYESTRKPFLVKCNTCGFEFPITPYHFKNGKAKCPNCQKGRIRMYNPQIVQQMLKGSNWEVVEEKERFNASDKIKFKCKNCGHIIATSTEIIVNQGYNCPNCSNKAASHTHKYYEDKITQKFGLTNPSYSWEGEGCVTSQTVKVFNDGIELYNGTLNNLLSRKTLGKQRNSLHDNYDIAIKNLEAKNIQLLTPKAEIKSTYTNVKVKCNNCGYVWATKFSNIVYNTFGCKKCQYTNNSKTSTSFFLEDKLHLLESEDIQNMSNHQLIELIGQDVLPREFKALTYTQGGSNERKNSIKELYKTLTNTPVSFGNNEGSTNAQLEKNNTSKETILETDSCDDNVISDGTKASLPILVEQELKLYDKYLVSYGEKNDYILKEELNKIWNCVLSNLSFLDTLRKMRTTSGNWSSYVIDTFFSEYENVLRENVDNRYKFPYEPSLMQKLMSYRIATSPYYGNWCGTGAGKTNAFLIASRRIDARITVCICPNSVVDTIQKSALRCYPDSNVIIIKSLDDIESFDRHKYNYVLINYEKFSQLYSHELIDKLTNLNTIDFICFDEVHRTKNSESSVHQNLINLRAISKVKNSKLKVLGMTATPLINNISEVKNLLELLTGESFLEIFPDNRNTLNNIHNAYKYLTLYGFRYVPDYNITTNEKRIKVICNDIADHLIKFENKDINDIEGALISAKYNAIKHLITNRTIIYTQFIKKIVPNIKKHLKKDGLTYRQYTGQINSDERAEILEAFARHDFDVLLASSPITTGVDGLQKICDNIIIMSLPWTNAEYTQLIGRVNRQGSLFTKVDIVIPQVFIPIGTNEMWSWDEKRYNIIKTKETLSNAVVDGVFSKVFHLNRKKLVDDALKSLKNGIPDFSFKRSELMPTFKGNSKKKQYNESIINTIHQKANTSTSSRMHEYFSQDKEKWKQYHIIREESKKCWPEDPLVVISEKIKQHPNWVVADLGCGMNKLKNMVNSDREWYSFDHVAIDDTVIEADISNLKTYLNDESVDCAVFCMSLWGVNYMDYIKEAYRYLKPGGTMYIVEPNDKVNQETLLGGATKIGFDLLEITKNRYSKTYLEFEKVR